MNIEPKESSMRSKYAYDYIDTYTGFFTDSNRDYTSTEIGKAFFTAGPKWVEQLFTIRNKIVKMFGLKTAEPITNRQKQFDSFKCEPGERMGLFRVFDKTQNEVVLGEDDKHLNFRVSLLYNRKTLMTERNSLTITTTVKFNNWFGRVYFLPVRLFHKIIVPAMLKGIVMDLEKQSPPANRFDSKNENLPGN